MLFRPEADEFVDRIPLAAEAGFKEIEFWRRSDKDIGRVLDAAGKAGVDIAGFLAEPTLALTDHANHTEFLEGFEESRDVARAMGARHMIVVTGDAMPDVPRADQQAAVVDCLSRAARLLAGSGVALVLEPINSQERPNGFLPSTAQGLDIVDAVGRPEVKLLFDIYHSAVEGEDLSSVLAGRADRLGHVHLADNPGRHEPGTGAIAWNDAARWLVANGYEGGFGLEYHPAGATVDGLGYLSGLRQAAA